MRARAILLLLLLWAPCATTYAEKEISDDQIYDEVRIKLAGDAEVKGANLQVEVHDGVVTLRGTVEKEKYKQKAERLTKKVKGVKKVVNDLKAAAR
jgi:hyperosmotically inducible protein